MTKYICGSCQGVINDSDKFCGECGEQLQPIQDAELAATKERGRVKPGMYKVLRNIRSGDSVLQKGSTVEVKMSPRSAGHPYIGKGSPRHMGHTYTVKDAKTGVEIVIPEKDPALEELEYERIDPKE